MRGPEEPVAVDGAKDREVAGREDHRAHRGALEARTAGLRVRHRTQAYRPVTTPTRRRYEPPNHRSIFPSTSSRGRPYRSRERRMTAARLPLAVPWMGGKVRPRKGSRIRP